ncbi:MAG TPA: hypothetical protein DEA47_00865 [Peptococcaceae bacterium]|nr:hypothetical protein [Peptococcaceae bacterium]
MCWVLKYKELFSGKIFIIFGFKVLDKDAELKIKLFHAYLLKTAEIAPINVIKNKIQKTKRSQTKITYIVIYPLMFLGYLYCFQIKYRTVISAHKTIGIICVIIDRENFLREV